MSYDPDRASFTFTACILPLAPPDIAQPPRAHPFASTRTPCFVAAAPFWFAVSPPSFASNRSRSHQPNSTDTDWRHGPWHAWPIPSSAGPSSASAYYPTRTSNPRSRFQLVSG
ncbi:hypothetical protein TPAR_08310 [Tolypocladium paradoxum]|uniref:Uncharacterized protein n=1 Tax=Tolypocladium paradoxum TaxID=94208 RepID=A0A2S4KMR0_9HYPO|nr:hypothetical protein TPAR_08310 [Tolypocladium paradoxum]